MILFWWFLFGGSHMVLSSWSVRQPLVARLGEGGFRGLYSAVAFACFIPLVWTYFVSKHAGPLLWALPDSLALRWCVYAAMGVAFTLLAASFVRPSPAAVVPGPSTPRGASRITRHPLLMSLAIFGLAHLLLNANATDVAFFGGFVLFSPLGAWHQDQRKVATGVAGYREFRDSTPFLPFTGAETLQGIRELGPVIAAGVVLTMIVRYFHHSWFGG
jgi:uncharacterized membrane protein